MPDVLQTKSGDPAREIAGVCRLAADGKGGALVEVAAENLRELQADDGTPLTGAALKSAARQFADDRGLAVASISEAKVDKLPELAGAAKDRPPAAEVAADNYQALYGDTPVDAAEAVEAGPSDTTTKEG